MITLSTYAKRLNVFTSAISYGVFFVRVKSTLQNMPTTNRMLSWMAMSVFASGVVLSGCGPAMTRPQRERNDLVKLRTTGDEQTTAAIRKLLTRLMERIADQRLPGKYPTLGQREGGLGNCPVRRSSVCFRCSEAT
jgi:hypothetical protein